VTAGGGVRSLCPPPFAQGLKTQDQETIEKKEEENMAQITTVEVVGPAGRIVINEEDLARYRAMGYRLPDEPEGAGSGDGDPSAGDDASVGDASGGSRRQRRGAGG